MRSGVKRMEEREGPAPISFPFWWSGHMKQKDTGRKKIVICGHNDINFVHKHTVNIKIFINRITQSLKDLVAGSME